MKTGGVLDGATLMVALHTKVTILKILKMAWAKIRWFREDHSLYVQANFF
jgi:hypothetical protein